MTVSRRTEAIAAVIVVAIGAAIEAGSRRAICTSRRVRHAVSRPPIRMATPGMAAMPAAVTTVATAIRVADKARAKVVGRAVRFATSGRLVPVTAAQVAVALVAADAATADLYPWTRTPAVTGMGTDVAATSPRGPRSTERRRARDVAAHAPAAPIPTLTRGHRALAAAVPVPRRAEAAAGRPRPPRR